MNPLIILGVACAFLLAAVVGEGYVIAGKNDTIQAKQDEIDKTWKVENKSLAAKLELANGEINNVHAMMDALDIQARSAKEIQQKQARELAIRLQSATDIKNAAIAQLQEEIDARPEAITVSVSDGWDPVVVAGMRKLRCVQLAAAGGQGDKPDCGLQGNNSAGRSGLAGDPAGAAYPRPSARQQLDFLAFAWSLREWGASCYDDKRAIAASQVTP